LLNLAACNLSGEGTFSWLLRFDTDAGTLTTGSAKPAADPTQGYSFEGQPATLQAPLDPSCGFQSSEGSINLTFYLNQAATQSMVLPLRKTVLSGKVSPDHTCIGAYNAAALTPANNCQGDAQTPTFLPGGQVSAFISLEEADNVVIDVLNQSLCVLLSGDAATWGDGGSPNRCARDGSNKILFKGDWCAASNGAATTSCADAMRVTGTFAASSVKIK